MEIQRQEKGADPHRARYHFSVMDIENLHSGQEFKELPDTYTIFIIETLKEGAISSAKRMLADGMLTLEKIAEYAGLSLDEVKKLSAERTA